MTTGVGSCAVEVLVVPEEYDPCLVATKYPWAAEVTTPAATEVGDLIVVTVAIDAEYGVDYQTRYVFGGDPPELCGLEETQPVAATTVLEYGIPLGWSSMLIRRHLGQREPVNGGAPDQWYEQRVYVHWKKATAAGEHAVGTWTLEPWSAMAIWANAEAMGRVWRDADGITSRASALWDGEVLDLNTPFAAVRPADVTAIGAVRYATPTYDDAGTFSVISGGMGPFSGGGYLGWADFDTDGGTRTFPTLALGPSGYASIVFGYTVGPRGGGITHGHPIGAGYSGVVVAR